jgi:hypothetical protein
MTATIVTKRQARLRRTHRWSVAMRGRVCLYVILVALSLVQAVQAQVDEAGGGRCTNPASGPSDLWLSERVVRQAAAWESNEGREVSYAQSNRTRREEPDQTRESVIGDVDSGAASSSLQPLPNWLDDVQVGYDGGFVIASEADPGIDASHAPFLLRVNGLGQLRHTHFDSENADPDLNQIQLIRGRLTFSGNAFTSDLRYFVQLDGRSSSGDEIRLLDYFMEFDLGRSWLALDRDAVIFKAGRYKVPFTFARFMSAREFQFSDRSVASTFFDLNRSLACGLAGQSDRWSVPIEWEAAIFNGFVTGGAETGSSGRLDNNFAYSARLFVFPTGDWGTGTLADFDWHETLATRIGAGYGGTTLDRNGPVEFDMIRVVDSGQRLAELLPGAVRKYSVNTFCVDASCKYLGWSVTSEYYFRNISGFQGDELPNLFDHGLWLEVGKFVIPQKLELLARWSRVVGSSGTLGVDNLSDDEIAGGLTWYFREQNAKLVVDVTRLDGSPVNSSALDISRGATGWLARTQMQFAF